MIAKVGDCFSNVEPSNLVMKIYALSPTFLRDDQFSVALNDLSGLKWIS